MCVRGPRGGPLRALDDVSQCAPPPSAARESRVAQPAEGSVVARYQRTPHPTLQPPPPGTRKSCGRRLPAAEVQAQKSGSSLKCSPGILAHRTRELPAHPARASRAPQRGARHSEQVHPSAAAFLPRVPAVSLFQFLASAGISNREALAIAAISASLLEKLARSGRCAAKTPQGRAECLLPHPPC